MNTFNMMIKLHAGLKVFVANGADKDSLSITNMVQWIAGDWWSQYVLVGGNRSRVFTSIIVAGEDWKTIGYICLRPSVSNNRLVRMATAVHIHYR